MAVSSGPKINGCDEARNSKESRKSRFDTCYLISIRFFLSIDTKNISRFDLSLSETYNVVAGSADVKCIVYHI